MPFTQTSDTSTATTSADDPVPSCAFGQGSNSVWYLFRPSQNSTVIADTAGSDYDTVLSAYTGSCGSLTEVACNDDSGDGLQSQITFDVKAGTTYLIEVTDFGDTPGGGLLVFNLRSVAQAMSHTSSGRSCKPRYSLGGRPARALHISER